MRPFFFCRSVFQKAGSVTLFICIDNKITHADVAFANISFQFVTSLYDIYHTLGCNKYIAILVGKATLSQSYHINMSDVAG